MTPSRDARAVLVCMPWASTARPSLGVGLLQAAARARGLHCDSLHPNLDMSALIGADSYELIAESRAWFALAEHLFAVDLFGADALDSDSLLAGFCEAEAAADAGRLRFSIDTLVTLRDVVVPAFLDQCARTVLDSDPSVVGFSCVFNQVLPSLALAHRLKMASPQVTTLLGGACVHGDMGRAYARAFPAMVDHVFTGEADGVFPEFLARHVAGRDVSDLPGIASGPAGGEPAPLVIAMDALPTPDFHDYFAQRQALELTGRRLVLIRELPYESARGCWWGEKHHCTFCGLNNEGLRFREKSADRVLQELAELSARHSCTNFSATDNILAHHAYTSLLPRLAEEPVDYHLFYEIKANVTRDDVAMLKRSGAERVQPGVESFSDHVLKLMRKGVSAAQNVQLLKWLAEYRIAPFFNLLVGFPGETDQDYEGMLALLPRLYHLPAPSVGRAIVAEVHRFSPFFDEPEALGITGTRAASYYRHLIPPDTLAAGDYAYFFDRDIPVEAPVHRYWGRVNGAIDAWTRHGSGLWAHMGAGFIAVSRTADGDGRATVLNRMESLAFVLMDGVTSFAKLSRQVETLQPGAGASVEAAARAVIAAGYAVEVGDRVVGVVPFARALTSAQLSAWVRRWAAVTGPVDMPAIDAVREPSLT